MSGFGGYALRRQSKLDSMPPVEHEREPSQFHRELSAKAKTLHSRAAGTRGYDSMTKNAYNRRRLAPDTARRPVNGAWQLTQRYFVLPVRRIGARDTRIAVANV
jgi:hypothetical protein